jgi:DHA1 family inner membrane transport protein
VRRNKPPLIRHGEAPTLSAMPLSLFALALAAFAIGTSEFVIMGLLPDLSRDLSVSIPQAGLLVTGYALGVVIGAPILAIATARLPRKAALLGLIGTYAIGNLLCAIAPTYTTLMAARVLTALCHGAFFGIGSVVAAQLVPWNKRGQAISIMFSGLTLANVLGVPAGTALGQAAGWRATFWVVVGIAVAATAAIAWALPRLPKPAAGNLLGEFAVLRKSQVLLAMLISVLSSASLFSVFTYIAPMLENVTHLSPHAVSWLLLLFGVGITAGNFLGGRLADWRLMPSVAGAFVAVIATLAAFTYTLNYEWPAAVTLLIWGMLTFVVASPLQMRVVDSAPEAPNLVATLNQGAFNLGNASGAWLGGLAIGAGVTYASLPWLGAALGAAALALTALSMVLEYQPRPTLSPTKP